MKTNLFDLSKRKFFLCMSAAALAFLKPIKFAGTAHAMGKTKEVSSNSFEKRIAGLEQHIMSQDQEIMRLQAINEIQNIMSTYEAIHNAYREKAYELFARHTPNTWMDVADWGIFVGFDSIKRVLTRRNSGVPQQGAPEHMQTKKSIVEHYLTNPVIQVARDGKTAKALWFAPGIKGSQWAFGKYGIDFVKEDGVWKIWHFKFFYTFLTPFDECWTESQYPKGMGDLKPDKPVRYNKPFNSDKWTGEAIPPAPQPYDTWTEKDEGWMYTEDENWGGLLSSPS